jgi:hypothetical protein
MARQGDEQKLTISMQPDLLNSPTGATSCLRSPRCCGFYFCFDGGNLDRKLALKRNSSCGCASLQPLSTTHQNLSTRIAQGIQ